MRNILIFGGIALIMLFLGCNSYNGMAKLDQEVQKSWGDVENNYQRRSDLIPNLVNTVKGAANFEQNILIGIAEARAKATSIKVDANDLTPEKLKEFQASQGQLSMALGRLMSVVESYPDLKANQNFRELSAQLEGTENRITVARKDFNDAVKGFNAKVVTFPNNLLGGMFGFRAKGYFQATAGSEKAPEVKF